MLKIVNYTLICDLIALLFYCTFNSKEKGIDPTINMVLFVGGGSELFRNVLNRVCPNAMFQSDVKANAIGYAKMASLTAGIPYED